MPGRAVCGAKVHKRFKRVFEILDGVTELAYRLAEMRVGLPDRADDFLAEPIQSDLHFADDFRQFEVDAGEAAGGPGQ